MIPRWKRSKRYVMQQCVLSYSFLSGVELWLVTITDVPTVCCGKQPRLSLWCMKSSTGSGGQWCEGQPCPWIFPLCFCQVPLKPAGLNMRWSKQNVLQWKLCPCITDLKRWFKMLAAHALSCWQPRKWAFWIMRLGLRGCRIPENYFAWDKTIFLFTKSFCWQ